MFVSGGFVSPNVHHSDVLAPRIVFTVTVCACVCHTSVLSVFRKKLCAWRFFD